MTENFLLIDVLAVSAALLLWLVILFIPGYVLGWLLDALGFRSRGLMGRCAITTPLAIALVPILTYHLWRFSLGVVGIFSVSCLAGFVVLWWREWRSLRRSLVISREARMVLAIIAGWFLLGMFWLVDLQFGKGIYFPVAAYDNTLRTAITASITNSGIPAQNPYFFPGHPVLLRYHYFWFMLCSLVDQLGGSWVTARHAMAAGTLWCGGGLLALVPLYLRFFRPNGSENLGRRMVVGISMLAVTGLDILPIVLVAVLGRHVYASVEWWNTELGAWVHSVLWVPHYIAALIACMTGFLVLRHQADSPTLGRRVLGGVVAGLAFASATGLGIYIAAVFAVFMLVWLAITLAIRRRDEAAVVCVAGLAAMIAATPYLFSLGGTGSGQGGGGFPIQFAVRPFFLADVMVTAAWPNPGWRTGFVNALMLPLNYFLELGFYFCVGVAQWRKMRRNDGFHDVPDLCAFSMAATSLVICSFFRSSVIANNDLAYRGVLIAQFVLVIWAADLWEGMFAAPSAGAKPAEVNSNRERRRLLAALIVIGVGGTLYEAVMFRFYPVLSDFSTIPRYGWLARDHHLGARTYALRQVYDQLRKDLAKKAILQHNPNAAPGDLFYGLYADRQAAAETSQCGVILGGEPALCAVVMGKVNDLFEHPRAVDADQVTKVCRDLGIDALVVKDTDKVWADRSSWVWHRKPYLANDYARVFRCEP